MPIALVDDGNLSKASGLQLLVGKSNLSVGEIVTGFGVINSATLIWRS